MELCFFSKSSFDFTTLSEYYFTKIKKPIYFSAGLGIDASALDKLMVNETQELATTAVFAADFYFILALPTIICIIKHLKFGERLSKFWGVLYPLSIKDK